MFSLRLSSSFFFFFFNDTATTEIYTLSLHDALPIYPRHLDRLLDRHAEHGHVEEHLEHRLLLDVATRSAERQRPAVLEGDGGRGCETRALARRHDAGMTAVEPTLRATPRHDASDTGHARPL